MTIGQGDDNRCGGVAWARLVRLGEDGLRHSVRWIALGQGESSPSLRLYASSASTRLISMVRAGQRRTYKKVISRPRQNA